jgi:hypothetical protein
LDEHIPERCKPGLAALHANLPLAHIQDKPAFARNLINKYLDGQSTVDQAKEYGVTRQRLNQILLQHAEHEWRTAQVAQAATVVEEAEEEVKTAPDVLALARARERLKAAQWRLERLCSRIFGQKQEITHSVHPILNITVAGSTQVAVQQPDIIDVVPEQQIIETK